MNKKRIIVVIIVSIIIFFITVISTFMSLSSIENIGNEFDTVDRQEDLVSDDIGDVKIEEDIILEVDVDKEELKDEIEEDNIVVDNDIVEDNSSNKANAESNKNNGSTSNDSSKNSSTSGSSSSSNTSSNSSSNSSSNNSGSTNSSSSSGSNSSSSGSSSNSNNNNGNSNGSNTEVDKIKSVENSNLTLTCNSSYITNDKVVSCSLAGKVSQYKVSALSAVIDDSNIDIVSFTTDSIWQGDGNFGRIDLYTDIVKESYFNIGIFEVKLKDNYSLDIVKITIKEVTFYDESFTEHSIDSLSLELEVK